MPARAMWKAEIALGSLKVPVKLYAAVQDRKVHFRLLHEKDMAPVVQQMVDPTRDEPVPKEDIRRGIEVERGVFVLLSDEEQAQLEPPPSREIRIEQVVARADVDERWFDRPYYFGPDGDTDRYFSFAEALAAEDCLAIARFTMRKKRYAGAVHARDGYLMLVTLRHTQEMVQIDSLRTPADRVPDKRELKLAEQLVSALEDDFDATAYRDEHREKVLAFVETKAAGKVVRFPKRKPEKSGGSLLEDLEASLKQGRKASGGN